MTLFISNARALVACDGVVDAVDAGTGAGTLRIYAGSVPADADASLASANTLLAQLTMSDPAFGAAADATPGATATANAITDDSSADATGTATFFRILDSDLLVICQGAVTATGGGGELELNTTAIVAGAAVAITSLTVTMPES